MTDVKLFELEDDELDEVTGGVLNYYTLNENNEQVSATAQFGDIVLIEGVQYCYIKNLQGTRAKFELYTGVGGAITGSGLSYGISSGNDRFFQIVGHDDDFLNRALNA